jgi:hypothetical protein
MIGSVETRLCRAAALDSINKLEHPGMSLARMGISPTQAPELLALAVEIRLSILNPPPSAARLRAQAAQIARGEA